MTHLLTFALESTLFVRLLRFMFSQFILCARARVRDVIIAIYRRDVIINSALFIAVPMRGYFCRLVAMDIVWLEFEAEIINYNQQIYRCCVEFS